MLVVVTYDVRTETAAGRRRLRKVAQVCKNLGQRVQKSVFECVIEPQHLVILRKGLLKVIDKEEDSLRLYLLDEKVRQRIEHYGVGGPVNLEDPLIV